MSKKRKIVLVTGLSGAGKTELVKEVTKSYPEKIGKFVTSTSRPIRPNEVHGKDYFFRNLDEFNTLLKDGKLFEYEEVYSGKFYGCEYEPLQKIIDLGKIAIAPVDVKGALKFLGLSKAGFVDLAVINPKVFFIDAPKDQLINRIKKDNESGERKDTEEDVNQRIERMEWELSQRHHFEKIINNEDGRFPLAYNELVNQILHAA